MWLPLFQRPNVNLRLRVISLALLALGLLVLDIVWVLAQPSHPVALIRGG